MKGVRLEQLTWPEAERALLRLGTVVLPVGARTKEHGLHLPLNTDWLTAQHLADTVVNRLPVVLLPTLPYGYYPAFVDYPGSVSLRLDAFRDTVIDIALSMSRHGARRCYVLNNGISTNRGLEPARLALAKDGVLMEFTDLTRLAAETRARIAEQPEGTHADELETSLLLSIAPELVRLERARRDIPGRPGRGPFTRDPDAPSGHYSPTGAWGDPTLATAEKGRILLHDTVQHLLEEIRQFMTADFKPAPARQEYL